MEEGEKREHALHPHALKEKKDEGLSQWACDVCGVQSKQLSDRTKWRCIEEECDWDCCLDCLDRKESMAEFVLRTFRVGTKVKLRQGLVAYSTDTSLLDPSSSIGVLLCVVRSVRMCVVSFPEVSHWVGLLADLQPLDPSPPPSSSSSSSSSSSVPDPSSLARKGEWRCGICMMEKSRKDKHVVRKIKRHESKEKEDEDQDQDQGSDRGQEVEEEVKVCVFCKEEKRDVKEEAKRMIGGETVSLRDSDLGPRLGTGRIPPYGRGLVVLALENGLFLLSFEQENHWLAHVFDLDLLSDPRDEELLLRAQESQPQPSSLTPVRNFFDPNVPFFFKIAGIAFLYVGFVDFVTNILRKFHLYRD